MQHASTRPSPPRSRLRIPAILAANAVVTILLLEVALRLYPGLVPLAPLRYFHPDLRRDIAKRLGLISIDDVVLVERDDGGPPHRVYTFVPGQPSPNHENRVLMDEMGFCNPDPSAYRAERFDVIAIGDSYTFCFQIPPESSWPHRFSQQTGLSIYNLGMPNAGPHEYVQYLKRFGLAKHPALVIMNIYEGNDIWDAFVFHRYTAAREGRATPNARATSLFYRARDVPILRHSYAYNLVLTGSATLYRSRIQRADQYERWNLRYSLDFPEVALPMNRANLGGGIADDLTLLRKGEADLDTLLTGPLRDLVDLSKQHGFVPVVTFSPRDYAVYDEVIVWEDPEVGELYRWAHEAVVSFLTESSRELGFWFLDLTPSLREAGRRHAPEALLYKRGNSHWTELGYQAAADAIAEFAQLAGRQSGVLAGRNGSGRGAGRVE